MEGSGLRLNGQGYKTPLGDLGIWVPARTILLVKVAGIGDARFSSRIIDQFDELSREGNSIRLFFDLEQLETYDSRLRTDLTAYLSGHRPELCSLHVLVKSRLVAMGVTVANLALGGSITSHGRRDAFARALDAELVAQRVVGFSSNVLAA